LFIVEESPEAPEKVDVGQENMNAETFVGSTCRGEEPGCSIEGEMEAGYEADTEDDDDDELSSSLNYTASTLWNNEASPMEESQAVNEESSVDTLDKADCSDEKSNCQEKGNDERCHWEAASVPEHWQRVPPNKQEMRGPKIRSPPR
jgi:hypothetical protein